MSTPLDQILQSAQTTASKIAEAVPIVRSTVSQITTIAQGKTGTPAPSQQPATVNALNPTTGAMAASGFLMLGGVAVLVILLFAVRRR